MAQTYYKAEGGILHGMTHYTNGAVFAADETIDAHFARTGGKSSDGSVLYTKASQKDYDAYQESLGTAMNGAPAGVVGFDSTGEDSLVESQTGDDGKPVEAAKVVPTDGDPVPALHPEAERRASGESGTASGTSTTSTTSE